VDVVGRDSEIGRTAMSAAMLGGGAGHALSIVAAMRTRKNARHGVAAATRRHGVGREPRAASEPRRILPVARALRGLPA
jgi:hypothetical protein